MSFDTMIKWIIVGFPWDILHAVSNFFIGSLAVPLALLMKRIAK
jgi:energy-coupling factor transport system substrate-specific component